MYCQQFAPQTAVFCIVKSVRTCGSGGGVQGPEFTRALGCKASESVLKISPTPMSWRAQAAADKPFRERRQPISHFNRFPSAVVVTCRDGI